MKEEMKRKKKEPLIRTVKRTELSQGKAVVLRIAALFAALVAGGLFILAIGYHPLHVYKTMVSGAFRSKLAFQGTIKVLIPLLITSLGVTLAFKMKFWNIGAEGQLIMGAVFASYFALFQDTLPHWLLILLMLLAGMIGGGLMGLLPAYFKSKYNTNETLFTLMLNYIAFNVVVFLREGPWRDPASPGYAKIARFSKNAQLDKVFGIHAGWIFAIIILIFVAIYLYMTKRGYEIAVVGESQATARYAGMNVKKIVLRTMFLSGGICGIAGMIEASGSAMTLTSGIAGGVGFTAIIVAWLGALNPLSIFIVASLFSIMEKGSSVVESTYGLSGACADVLQGIILFFVLGCEFFVRYRFVVRKERGARA
ncbi:MAG: ABC transporter permease [Lachnospiraceae bacterium]|nr:ABC transporter permease [Lachnospiraceae bacterium]